MRFFNQAAKPAGESFSSYARVWLGHLTPRYEYGNNKERIAMLFRIKNIRFIFTKQDF